MSSRTDYAVKKLDYRGVRVEEKYEREERLVGRSQSWIDDKKARRMREQPESSATERTSTTTEQTSITYSSNQGGSAANFGSPKFRAPVHITIENRAGNKSKTPAKKVSAKKNETSAGSVRTATQEQAQEPEPSVVTTGRTHYHNNTGGRGAIFGNATYEGEYTLSICE